MSVCSFGMWIVLIYVGGRLQITGFVVRSIGEVSWFYKLQFKRLLRKVVVRITKKFVTQVRSSTNRFLTRN